MSSAVTEATGFISRMVSQEKKRWGDEENALRRIAGDYELPFWTLNNLLRGRAKKVDADIRDSIRSAFIDHCRSHAARLLHDAEVAAAKENKNDVLDDIQDQIRALAARLAAAKGDQERPRP